MSWIIYNYYKNCIVLYISMSHFDFVILSFFIYWIYVLVNVSCYQKCLVLVVFIYMRGTLFCLTKCLVLMSFIISIDLSLFNFCLVLSCLLFIAYIVMLDTSVVLLTKKCLVLVIFIFERYFVFLTKCLALFYFVLKY